LAHDLGEVPLCAGAPHRGAKRVVEPNCVLEVAHRDALAPEQAGEAAQGSVDPGTARVMSSGPEGLRVLCIGGVPGGIYEPPDWSSAGE
jgi:hypothetical protein